MLSVTVAYIAAAIANTLVTTTACLLAFLHDDFNVSGLEDFLYSRSSYYFSASHIAPAINLLHILSIEYS